MALDTVVRLPDDARIGLGDSSWIVVQDDHVGHINHFGHFSPFTPGIEIIHGTHIYNEESIGEAVSHGCVRMRNEDLTRLYPLVPVGTKVTIF